MGFLIFLKSLVTNLSRSKDITGHVYLRSLLPKLNHFAPTWRGWTKQREAGPGPVQSVLEWLNSSKKGNLGEVHFFPDLQCSSKKIKFERISLPRWNDHQKNVRWHYINLIHSNHAFFQTKKWTRLHWFGLPNQHWTPVLLVNSSTLIDSSKRLLGYGPLRVHDFLAPEGELLKPSKIHTHISTSHSKPKTQKRPKTKKKKQVLTWWPNEMMKPPKALVWDLCGIGDWRYHSSEWHLAIDASNGRQKIPPVGPMTWGLGLQQLFVF